MSNGHRSERLERESEMRDSRSALVAFKQFEMGERKRGREGVLKHAEHGSHLNRDETIHFLHI